MKQELNKLLQLISLSKEEKRIIELLLERAKKTTPRELSYLYEQKFGLKIGTKVYFLLKRLYERELVEASIVEGTTYYSCERAKLRAKVRWAIEEEYKNKVRLCQALGEIIAKPSIEVYSDKQVAKGFYQLNLEQIKEEGSTWLDIRDILPYAADTVDGLKRRRQEYDRPQDTTDFLDFYRLDQIHDMFKKGLLRQVMVLDKIQTFQGLKRWLNEYGSSYVMARLDQFTKLLELPNYQVIFSVERVNFLISLTPKKIAALYWRSKPLEISDRLMVFHDPVIVGAFEDFFWQEYSKALGSKSEKEAKDEVREWVRSIVHSIRDGKLDNLQN